MKKTNGVTQKDTQQQADGYSCLCTYGNCASTPAWTITSTHGCTHTHTHLRETLTHTLLPSFSSIIRNSCRVKNELTLPRLAVALNIHFLTKYYNIIVLLSKVKWGGGGVARVLSCCDGTCFWLCIRRIQIPYFLCCLTNTSTQRVLKFSFGF